MWSHYESEKAEKAYEDFKQCHPLDYGKLKTAYYEFNWDTSFQQCYEWEDEMSRLFSFVENLTEQYREGNKEKVEALLHDFAYRNSNSGTSPTIETPSSDEGSSRGLYEHEKEVVYCPKMSCGRPMNVPIKSYIKVTCPHCGNVFAHNGLI